MSRKSLVLSLVTLVAIALAGCGGSSPDKTRLASANSAARDRLPEPTDNGSNSPSAHEPLETPGDEHVPNSSDPEPDPGQIVPHSINPTSPAPTSPTWASAPDHAEPADSSKFDPQRFELPAPNQFLIPAPAPSDLGSPDSAPPTTTRPESYPAESSPTGTFPSETSPPAATPPDSQSPDSQSSVASSPESFDAETGRQNPLRRPIVRSPAAGANNLRGLSHFAAPRTVFAPPPRANDAPQTTPDATSTEATPREVPSGEVPAPVAPSPVAPSPVAPSPVAPSPIASSTGAPAPDDASPFDPSRLATSPNDTPLDDSPTAAGSTEPVVAESAEPTNAAPPTEVIQHLLVRPGDGQGVTAGDNPENTRSPASLADFAIKARAGAADASDSPEPAKSVHEAAAADDPNSPFTTMRVFYATDRAAEDAASAAIDATYRRRARLWVVILGVTALIGAGVCIHHNRRVVGGTLATAAVAASIFMWVRTSDSKPPLALDSASMRVAYRNERGNLELGQCEVTIPKIHHEGQVERPQVWRLEFQERADKHMILKTIERRAPDVFFAEVRGRVKQSPSEDLFVFVHGYNVSFETAALRTAQMAKDLEFRGAPIFYSWPSQGGLLRYTVDENNVTWTVPHLKQFLRDLAEKSDAKAIHLIAHSMGNRALTAALREMTFESRDKGLHFQQVVLAAPDIDAEVFRRDIAPVLSGSADRVTLYASSNDQALAASKLVHGYPRAGDSGRDLVVVPGIDTIDVSAADTSLLGHSYYGSSELILHDLKMILGRSQPASVRPWLEPSTHDGRPYWVFDIRSAALATQNTRR